MSGSLRFPLRIGMSRRSMLKRGLINLINGIEYRTAVAE